MSILGSSGGRFRQRAGSRGPAGALSEALLGPSVSRLPADEPVIALTFDDGPSNETSSVLDRLDRHGIKATFFMCGANVERRPGTATAVAEAGHAVGNHTYSHPFLPACGSSRTLAEIASTQDLIERATQRRPTLFRPPYGFRSPALRKALPRLGLTSVLWSVIGNDWKWSARRVARRVLANASPGGIVCLHDGDRIRREANRAATIAAIDLIVPRLLADGYRFVRLPCPGGPGNPRNGRPAPTAPSSRRR